MMNKIRLMACCMIWLLPTVVIAQGLSLPALTIEQQSDNTTTYSISLQILFIMTVLTLLPSFILMMTSFTRIIIVLAILRQALGLPQTPTNQILVGITLFLSLFIMMPVLEKSYQQAVVPYMNEDIAPLEALARVQVPFRDFMLKQTRRNDLELFMRISGTKTPESIDNVALSLLVPAFVTSELKTAFEIGFILFLPFLVIDLIVASALMSMGMMMLSPIIISLPFKIMLFILIDGWALIIGTLASSFGL